MPDVFEQWKGLDYREQVSPSAVSSVWLSHPPGARWYNAVFDEWDLWIPPNLPPLENQRLDENAGMFDVPEGFHVLDEDLEAIYPREDPQAQDSTISFPDSAQYMRERYGVCPQLRWRLLALADRDYAPSDGLFRGEWSNWISHLLATHRHTEQLSGYWPFWDLKPECPQFLFTDELKANVRVTSRRTVIGDMVYEIRYRADPPTMPWVLVADIYTLIFLLRIFPVVTATPIPVVYQHKEHLNNNKMPASELDYRAYRLRALNVLSGGTQLRAALAEGGIVWRIAFEFMSSNARLHHLASEVTVMPPVLGRGARSHADIFEPCDGTSFLDNCLTEAEADLLCGICKVYTSNVFQYNSGHLLLMDLIGQQNR
ncbi:hypothetical protein L226DRAFT_523684 [Lentinus tigrinus ALCF2SS1-7]|uniref:uncharacterized protein n=1 Tax=Lentinus tigrinus ALCF2SS1-7 TaxID=1328758 RepID=UPI0011661981|nr:hypothetical protein L226DRAFT_523684 [Lentinus tigrinus ALCF2SS1-7]